jgi:hypothetical protein
MFGRICCLHFSIESVKCVEKYSIDAGHGGQKPVGNGGSTKRQFVNEKLCTNSEEAESLKKNFQGKLVWRNSEKEVSVRRLDITCVSKRAVE